MLIPLFKIIPSPFNPKKPLAKKQAAALRKNVETFGFQRSPCVCRDFYGGGDGFICLDGNTALDLLRELGKAEIDCYIVEKVTDDKSLKKFMAGYSISREPLYSEFALELGELDFADFTGLSFDKYSFDVRIDDIDADMDALSGPSRRRARPLGGRRSIFLPCPVTAWKS